MANYNLTNQTISSSFQQLLQKDTDTGNLVDGLGNGIDGLNLTGSLNIQDTVAELTLRNASGTGEVRITSGPDYITSFNDATLTGINTYGGNTLSGSWGTVGSITNGSGIQNANVSPTTAGDVSLRHGVSYNSVQSNGYNGTLNLRGDEITMNGSSSVDSGVSLTVNGDVSASNFTGSFIGDGSQLTNLPIEPLPSGVVSGSEQIILQDTTGLLSGSRIDGVVADSTNSLYAQNTITTGKNLSGGELLKGTPLYFTGSGTQGNLVGVYPADAGNPDRMPAGGIAGEDIANGDEGIVLLDGYIGGVNTSIFASGDEIFVGVGGGYTNVAPTGSTNLIQHLGNVEKSAVNGSGVIQMMGEVRGLPNIQEGYVWVGNADGVATPTSTGSFGGGGTIDTGSFATTGSNTFDGDQTINGKIEVIQSTPTKFDGITEVSYPFTSSIGETGYVRQQFSNLGGAGTTFAQTVGGVDFAEFKSAPNTNLIFTSQQDEINFFAGGNIGLSTGGDTGSILLNGNTNANGTITQTPDSNNNALIQQGNFFSTYYGSAQLWQPEFAGGRSRLFVGEKSEGRITVNAYSGAYDNVIAIKADANGISFNDWDLPSYGDAPWMTVEQGGTPTFTRGLQIDGDTVVNGRVDATDTIYTDYRLQVNNPLGTPNYLILAQDSGSNKFAVANDAGAGVLGANVIVDGTMNVSGVTNFGTSGSNDKMNVFGGIVLSQGAGISTDGAFGPAVPFDAPVVFFGGASFNGSNLQLGGNTINQVGYLEIDGTNTAPGPTLQVEDGNGTPRLQVNNATLKGFTGVDVVVNGNTILDGTVAIDDATTINGNLENTGSFTNGGDTTIVGTNLAPGNTFQANDGNGTPILAVQNATLKGFTDVDVLLNGNLLNAGNFTTTGDLNAPSASNVDFGSPGNYVDNFNIKAASYGTVVSTWNHYSINAVNIEAQNLLNLKSSGDIIVSGSTDFADDIIVNGTNTAPGDTFTAKDGNGTIRLSVQNATLGGLTGVDVNINGKTQITETLNVLDNTVIDGNSFAFTQTFTAKDGNGTSRLEVNNLGLANATGVDVNLNGTVQITETLKMVAQDPLPSGVVGELAVSGSNLFFYNGSWTQVV